MNNKQKHILYWFIILVVILLAYNQYNQDEGIAPIGGETDEHGCLSPAGYQWCPSTQKCQRMWEEYCEEYAENFRIRNFEDCAEAGNPVMESYPMQCMANGITYVQDVGRTYCTAEQRNAEICTMEYFPVCGRKANDEPIKTYSNPCAGCSPEEVIYWTEGEC